MYDMANQYGMIWYVFIAVNLLVQGATPAKYSCSSSQCDHKWGLPSLLCNLDVQIISHGIKRRSIVSLGKLLRGNIFGADTSKPITKPFPKIWLQAQMLSCSPVQNRLWHEQDFPYHHYDKRWRHRWARISGYCHRQCIAGSGATTFHPLCGGNR